MGPTGKRGAAAAMAAALAAVLAGCASGTDAAAALPEIVPVTVTLPHPVSAADALTLRGTLDLAELLWAASNAAGGVTASSELSDAEVLRNFEAATAPYGDSSAAVTAVAVNVPAASVLNGATKLEPALAQLQRRVDDAAQRLPAAPTPDAQRVPD